MHTAISVLRGAAKTNERQEFFDDAAEHDRAADLLEALASPPETVEELRERGVKLVGHPIGVRPYVDDFGDAVCYDVHVDNGMSVTCTSIRAAWYAIVGMEVGR